MFRRLTNLERVDLSDTDVGDSGVLHLGRCKQLSWLSLCNTEVGDCCAASLTELVRSIWVTLTNLLGTVPRFAGIALFKLRRTGFLLVRACQEVLLSS